MNERAERVQARARASAGHIAIAATVTLLGFLLAIQLRGQQDLTDRLAFKREADLGQILTELTSRNDELADQVLELQLRLARAGRTQEQERLLVEDARAELDAVQVLLGIVPAKGVGVSIEIRDAEGTVGPEVLLDAIQELRDAGAEAIDIDGVRVVASTAVGGAAGDLRVGGTRIIGPYTILAIGEPATLAEAMRIPGGVVDTIGAREGASVRIEERRSVSILSTATLPRFRYARPQARR